MHSNGLLVTFFAAAFSLALLAGCDGHNPAKARGNVNRGSCLQALEMGVAAIRSYAQQHGKLPATDVNLYELIGANSDPVLGDLVSTLQYGGGESISLNSPKRTIVLICAQTVLSDRDGPGRYCALLSGEIVLLPQQEAVPGRVAPEGSGQTMLPNP